MIKFIVTKKNDFSKILLQEFKRESILGACRMEDERRTTQEEKDNFLDSLKCYFNGITFITNGRFGTKSDVLYAAFHYITTSKVVRKWVEGYSQPFGIKLELDLEQHTTLITCFPISEWMRVNQHMIIQDSRNES